MYCKNCGRKLEEGARFCDRCGQSVRQIMNSGKEAREREIKELQEERLNRKRRLEEREEKQNGKRSARKKRGGVFIFFIVVLLIMLISAFAGYFIYSRQIETDSNPVLSLNIPVETPDPESSPMPTPIPLAASSADMTDASEEGKETVTKDSSYKRIYLTDDVEFSYPSVFSKVSTNEDYAVLGLSDTAGDASITAYTSEYPGGTASSLMRAYANRNGGSIEYSRAGDDWYVITLRKNDEIYHRKYIFAGNDSVVYYDFQYNADSRYAEDYEDYIEYMDEQLSI